MLRSACTAAALLAALLCAPGLPRAAPDERLGTYRLGGRAWLDARPFPSREDELHADAVLAPGAAVGEVRLRISGAGATCELAARLDAAGGLTLAADQLCPVDLSGERAEGRVEGRLVSGSGRIEGDVLRLELTLALSGSVRLRSEGALGSIGEALRLPGVGRDPVPVRGQARGRAEGRRDRSRVAQREAAGAGVDAPPP